jgi:hypothetical protein
MCTYCSKDKDKSEGLLPADKRYKSKRIKKVHCFAKDRGFRFFILSGEYGLIHNDYEIPYYDHLLVCKEVPQLVEKIKDQLKKNSITRIIYYTEPLEQNPEIRPYICAIEEACKNIVVEFQCKILQESVSGG